MADQAEINGACLLLLAPALWGPVPNGIAHTRALVAVHTASAASCSSLPARTVWAPCTRVSPWAPSPPFWSVTGDNFALLVFLPCTHRACGSSPIPNPAALHLRGTQSSKISAAAREEEASLRSCICIVAFHQTTYGPPHLLPTHPCLPPFDTVACRSLALFPPFCLLFFFFQIPNHQTVDRLATGPTSQPKHRMSGSHKAHDHHHHPPLC